MAVRQAVMLEIPSMAICYGRYSHVVGAGNPSLAALFGGMKHEKETARMGGTIHGAASYAECECQSVTEGRGTRRRTRG